MISPDGLHDFDGFDQVTSSSTTIFEYIQVTAVQAEAEEANHRRTTLEKRCQLQMDELSSSNVKLAKPEAENKLQAHQISNLVSRQHEDRIAEYHDKEGKATEAELDDLRSKLTTSSQAISEVKQNEAPLRQSADFDLKSKIMLKILEAEHMTLQSKRSHLQEQNGQFRRDLIAISNHNNTLQIVGEAARMKTLRQKVLKYKTHRDQLRDALKGRADARSGYGIAAQRQVESPWLADWVTEDEQVYALREDSGRGFTMYVHLKNGGHTAA